MAKLNELLYDVREAIKEFSDDTEVDDRYIIYLYNTKRVKYLRQDLNNFQKVNDLSIQQKFCMELEEVNSDECNSDYYCERILRTKKPLPKPIELHTKPAIISVKPTSKLSTNFNFISRDRVPYTKHSRFTNSIYAFLDVDNYIYLISESDSHKLIDCITISGIFENPLELSNYKNCCNCNDNSNECFNEKESEYPLQPHYIDLIKSEIVNDLLRMKQIPEDKTNDSTDPTYDAK